MADRLAGGDVVTGPNEAWFFTGFDSLAAFEKIELRKKPLNRCATPRSLPRKRATC